MTGVAVWVLTATAVLLSACAPGSGGLKPRSGAGEWSLEWMHGRGPVTPLDKRPAPTITMEEDGALKGHTGVNQLSRAVDADGLNKGEWRPGPVAMTKMAGPPEAMELESAFVGLLSRATRYRVDEGPVLVLSDASGELLRFGRKPRGAGETPAPSIDGEWVADWMQERGAVTPPAGRESPRLSIAADGAVRGWTGVNHLSGALDAGALKRGEFAPGPMAMTEMAGPPDAMELEREFVGLVSRATRYRVDEGPVLVLSDGAGELVRFRPKP